MSKFQNDAIFWVDVDKIDPNPYQPRRDFNEEGLRDLAESIRQYGVLQPLTVTRNEETKEDGGLKVYYELIAGERRLRAAKMANLSQVPVTIRDEKEDAEVKLELAIIENLQREDLNPIERAEAFNQLSEEFEFTHKEIAEKIGKSREYVSNSMRLLKLPEKIKQAVIAGKITEGHARPIMMLRDKPEKQQQLFKEVVRKDLTVRETEERARRDAQDKVRKKKNKIDPETKALEEELSDTLGTRVTIEKDKEGGKLVIDFFSDEDLEGLIEMVKNNEDASMDDVMKEYANALNGEKEDSEKDSQTETENEKAVGEEQDKPAQTKEGEDNKKGENDQLSAQADTKQGEQKVTNDNVVERQQGQSMAETLGTMIQQARAEQESQEAKEEDKQEQDETQSAGKESLTDSDPESTEAGTRTAKDAGVGHDTAEKAASSQDSQNTNSTANTKSTAKSQTDTESTVPHTSQGKSESLRSSPQSQQADTPLADSSQAVSESPKTANQKAKAKRPEEEDQPTNTDQSEKSLVDQAKQQDDTQSENNAHENNSVTGAEPPAQDKQGRKEESVSKETKTDTEDTEENSSQDKEGADNADEEDDMYAVSNFSV